MSNKPPVDTKKKPLRQTNIKKARREEHVLDEEDAPSEEPPIDWKRFVPANID